MDTQVAEQPTGGQHDRHEQPDEQGGFGERVVSREHDDENQGAEGDEEQGDDAVKASRLRVRPRIERPDDLPPVVGVGAAFLARACVADVGSRAVADEAPLAVELVWPQLLALGADPVVVCRVVREPGGAVAQ